MRGGSAGCAVERIGHALLHRVSEQRCHIWPRVVECCVDWVFDAFLELVRSHGDGLLGAYLGNTFTFRQPLGLADA